MIEVNNLTKKYKDNIAVDNVSISIPKGKIWGLLGPNGAGKSTLIKSIVGGVKPNSGTVTILGKDPLKNKASLSHKFGYMPQDLALYGDLSAYENVEFFGKLHNQDNLDKKINDLLEFLDILSRKGDKVQNFSGGMERRVSLACAIIHDPEILILDEPTAGLDPALKRTLWKFFRDLSNKGKTFIISTHLMEEAVLCDNLALMQKGKIIANTPVKEIISKGKTSIKIQIDDKDILEKIPTDPEKLAGELKKYGLKKNIKSIEIVADNLEDIVIDIMENQK